MDEELIALREEMRQGFTDMRQDMRQGFVEIRQELGQGFVRVDERLGQLDQNTSELRQDVAHLQQDVAHLQQDVVELGQGLATLTQRVDVLEERVRANGVLLEAIRDGVRQIAEAHVLLAQRVADYPGERDTQRTILSLLQTSYRDLDRRVSRLEERAGETGPWPRA
jgi:chromosome segregation ATPase